MVPVLLTKFSGDREHHHEPFPQSGGQAPSCLVLIILLPGWTWYPLGAAPLLWDQTQDLARGIRYRPNRRTGNMRWQVIERYIVCVTPDQLRTEHFRLSRNAAGLCGAACSRASPLRTQPDTPLHLAEWLAAGVPLPRSMHRRSMLVQYPRSLTHRTPRPCLNPPLHRPRDCTDASADIALFSRQLE
jgi:hypothetical protein